MRRCRPGGQWPAYLSRSSTRRQSSPVITSRQVADEQPHSMRNDASSEINP
jgi:hypothetical protein